MSNQIILTVTRSGGSAVAEQNTRFNIEPGSGQALTIPAADHTDYRFTDAATGLAPEGLAFNRVGDHLYIHDKASGKSQPDIIIENYYNHAGNKMPGLQADGVLSPYYGEISSPITAEQVTVHQTAGTTNKMAIALSSLAGAGLLGALAGGGGGGGGSSESPPAATIPAPQPIAAGHAILNNPASSAHTAAQGKTIVSATPNPSTNTTPLAARPSETAKPSETVKPVISDGQTGGGHDYHVYQHPKYGKYIDAAEFGTDPSGRSDSLPAINAALAAAHKENAAVYLSGNLYISNQMVLNKANSGVTALFGNGMGNTTISFDKAQTGVFNSDTNEDDVRAFAGILIDGQSNKTIADLSVKYTHPDFYRSGQSYFGKVNGIVVNDADNTLISKVEVSGANRAGVFFTSTHTLQPDPQGSQGRTYKARLIRGEVDETYENLPLGENNRIIDSNLHHNRVAGVLLAYQKNFIADNNVMSWNGHEKDGGTGYGIASMAGSYNYGITFRNNTTDHNYRKGLDVHDGDNIVIENNVSIGDRLYGIGVYNRQFTMDTVKVHNNTVIADPEFRLAQDDNPGLRYFGYSGIQLQTNTMFRDLHSGEAGHFEISRNTIKNLDVYRNAIQTYGIEFRNHEPNMHYTLDIAGNTIEGASVKYAIAVINNTKSKILDTAGQGSGTINVTDNTIDIGSIGRGTLPVFINEESNNGKLRGEVTFSGNNITIREHSDGTIEGVQMVGNAETYRVTDNTFEIRGTMDKPVVSLLGRTDSEAPELIVSGNNITTDLTGNLYRSWIERNATVDVYADNNTHNGKELAEVHHTVTPPASEPAPGTVEAAKTAYVLDLGIGSNTISGNDTHETAYPRIAAAQTATVSENTAKLSGQLSDGLPALNDLLAVNDLDLSNVLGAGSSTAGTIGATVAEYTRSLDINEEQWQNEVSAHII